MSTPGRDVTIYIDKITNQVPFTERIPPGTRVRLLDVPNSLIGITEGGKRVYVDSFDTHVSVRLEGDRHGLWPTDLVEKVPES